MSKTFTESIVVDTVIRQKYEFFDTPVDQIVSDESLAKKFAKLVNAELPDSDKVELTWLKQRLLSLRKRGEDKGGLPRIRRSYFGRDKKPERNPNKPR